MRNFDKLIGRAATIGLGLAVASGAAFAQGTPDQPSTDPALPTDPAATVPATTPAVPPPVVTDPAPITTTTTTQSTTTVEPVYQPVAPEQSMMERYGVGFVLGGGVEGFTDHTMRTSTQTGGNWDVRAIFGTRQYLAVEAAYIGSAQGIDALGLDNSAVLVGNGVEGALRLNFTKDQLVQPFVFAGAAWRRYDLKNASFNTSAVRSEDDVLEIPMGAGLAYHYRGLMFDARGEFRAATQEDLMPSLTNQGDSAKMHRWGANLNVGYAF
ncbi:MAG TPA: hypothetical protein VGM90_34905 [Kofleriaceae bacterium]